MPISAVDTITLAFQHTKRQLIQPFRFWQWTRLALVGLLAGEMSSSGGGFNFPTNFRVPQEGGGSRHFVGPELEQIFPHIDPMALAGIITVLVCAFLVFAIIMMYISSVMRFILFDSVLAKECHIGQGWSRRQQEGWRFFLWQLGLSLVTLVVFGILIGVPALLAFGAGWFKAPREHLVGLILGGILLFIVLVAISVVSAVIHVMTKDFVVPQMALEGIGAIEGWRRLWPLLQAEKGGYTIYVLMKIVLAIGAGIVLGIATLIVTLAVAIPAVGLAIVVAISGNTGGFAWNAYTITVAVVVGCILFAIFMYLVALISVPAIVFFPAYAIYFFAPRYRPLSLVLYPPPPPSPVTVPAQWPPPEPPPLPPTPVPIG